MRHTTLRATPGWLRARPGARLAVLLFAGALPAVFLALAAGGTVTSSQALDLGDENSWIRVQNVGQSSATIQVEHYDATGNVADREYCPAEGLCSSLPPGLGWTFFQQVNPDLPEGFRGSALITADQPFVALMGRDVLRPDGTFQIAGDTLRPGAPAPRHFVPLVQHTADYVSRIAVENTSREAAACVEVRYYAAGSLTPAAVDPPEPDAGCSGGGAFVPPQGTLIRDERTLTVPLGFDGAAEVRTYETDPDVPAASYQLSVVVDTRARNGAGLSSYRGVGGDEASRTVVLPLIERNAPGGNRTWTTRFRIVSADPAAANEVTLRFEGRDDEGERVEIEHTVEVQRALTCDQRSDGAGGCLPDDQPLPDVFTGVVRVEAAEPVAVAVQRLGDDGSLADYRGVSGDAAGREVVLPIVNKHYDADGADGASGGGDGWDSWFRVVTLDGSTAQVHMAYYSRQLPNGMITQPVPVEGQHTFRQWEEGRLPDGWVGSAFVISDTPVVVVAGLERDALRGDPVMLYNGVSLD